MKRYCFALDLVDDEKLIQAYDTYHKKVWPEVLASIKASGIIDMEIYRVGNRLFMIMEVDSTFNVEQKKEIDASNPKVQEWETLMWQYQKALPWAKDGEKWIKMERIFKV